MAPLLTEHFQTGILQKMIYYMNVHMIYQFSGMIYRRGRKLPMAPINTKRETSLSKKAYDQIKSMILQKDLAPGQFVNESQLQEFLGLGRTPVREAILALAQDNLVQIHPRKGIEITRPTPKSIHDIFEIRLLLEPMILRQCFYQVDLQWATDMRNLLLEHQDDEAGQTGQTASPLIALDNKFHLDLVDTLHNQYASQLMRSLVDYLNLIRITAWKPLRYQISNQEHIAILDAILNQQQDTACQLLADHIQLSYEEAINTMMHSSF